MSEEQKADELIEKFWKYTSSNGENETHYAKQYAIICCDQIINNIQDSRAIRLYIKVKRIIESK